MLCSLPLKRIVAVEARAFVRALVIIGVVELAGAAHAVARVGAAAVAPRTAFWIHAVAFVGPFWILIAGVVREGRAHQVQGTPIDVHPSTCPL